MKLQYHRATFALLGRLPRVSPVARRKLRKLERHGWINLPPAVREWYLLKGAASLLAKPFAGSVVDITKRRSKDLAEVREGDLLSVLHENQGVCSWAVLIDGSADPPVFIRRNAGVPKWEKYADHFSTFVYALIWDGTVVGERGWRLTAENISLSKKDVALLRKGFRAGPTTPVWPGQHNYRAFKDDQRVLIWQSSKGSSVYLHASSRDSLAILTKKAWRVGGLHKKLHGFTRAEDTMLKQLQNGA